MLKIKNVSKNFGEINALTDINFSIKQGELVALLGENGAGKSTLLRIISGYLEATQGEVWLDKLEINQDRLNISKKSGYVQEISSLYEELTVNEYLLFVANIRQIPIKEIDEKIKKVITLLDLKNVITQQTNTLSKGFKKRTELAAALLSEPELLILDEPTEGLDPNQKDSIRKAIKQYSKKHTIIISTHTMEEVEAIASRVLLLHKGKLQADMSLKEFKKISNNNLLKSFKKITNMEQ